MVAAAAPCDAIDSTLDQDGKGGGRGGGEEEEEERRLHLVRGVDAVFADLLREDTATAAAAAACAVEGIAPGAHNNTTHYDSARREDATFCPYQPITDGLLDSLIPPHQSGRASLWILTPSSSQSSSSPSSSGESTTAVVPSTGTYRLASTSSRGEPLDGPIDEEMDLDSRVFLSSLSRGAGLYTSKKEIEEKGVPNRPGYDQLMYAACLRARQGGRMVAVLGVGIRDTEKDDDTDDPDAEGTAKKKRLVWDQTQFHAVKAVADMITLHMVTTSFLSDRADQLDKDRDQDVAWGANPLRLDRVGRKETDIQRWAHEQTSEILGTVAEKLRPFGLRAVSAWEYDDGDLMLLPGRRTRSITASSSSADDGDFEETPIDTCETIAGCSGGDARWNWEVTRMAFVMARQDYMRLTGSAMIDGAEVSSDLCIEECTAKLREWIDPRNFGEDDATDPRPSQIVRFEGKDDPTPVSANVAARIGGLASCPEDVRRFEIVLMPVMVRGCLHAVLSFAFDSEAMEGGDDDDEAAAQQNLSQVLRHGLRACKRLAAVRLGHRVLRSSIHVPDMTPLISQIRTGNAVALTGAGFSIPAGLMNWGGLLRALLQSAADSKDVDGDQGDYIDGLIQEGTADSFDKAAQTLEDVLGDARMEHEISQLLAIDFQSMPRLMQWRVKTFMDIPWRAVLTTNYDMCFKGPTPLCSDVGHSYVNTLRSRFVSMGDKLIMNCPATPVIKLHGCVQRGNIIFTRSGYRKLLYRASGYKCFLQSTMASHTLVSMGHSGTDAYLNELFGELLTMFGQSNLPLRYSVMPASDGATSFAKRYDGLTYLRWDKDMHGWGCFDYILQKLRYATSPRARMRTMLRGRRLCLVESPNVQPRDGWNLEDLAVSLYDILPSANIHLLGDSRELNGAISRAAANVAPYDILLLVFDEQTTPKVLETNRRTTMPGWNLPVAVIASDCPGSGRGIAELGGDVRVLQTMAHAAEYLFDLFEHDARRREGLYDYM